MKSKYQILFSLLLTIGSYALYGNIIPFEGEAIMITGSFANLKIDAGNSNEIDICNLNSTPNQKLAYQLNHKATYTEIILEGKNLFSISIPIETRVVIKPEDVAGESGWYQNQDNYKIEIKNLSGEIEILADGYDLNLTDLTGAITAITYGDIIATFNKQASRLVALDSYQGNILVKVPRELKINVNATARKGMVTIAEVFKADGSGANLKADKINIKHLDYQCEARLHIENGEFIEIKELTDPTHPELRDQLIKMFIRDQGKKGMATGTMKELITLGYEDYINAQPDIRPFLLPELRKELFSIIDEYGFPTPVMVGGGYAMKGVMIILLNSGPEVMDIYKEDFVKHFGQRLLDIYYEGPNGRRK